MHAAMPAPPAAPPSSAAGAHASAASYDQGMTLQPNTSWSTSPPEAKSAPPPPPPLPPLPPPLPPSSDESKAERPPPRSSFNTSHLRCPPPPPIDPTRHTLVRPQNRRGGRSAVWEWFRVVAGDTEDVYKDFAFCLECKGWWRRPGGSTYGLLKHIHGFHGVPDPRRPGGKDNSNDTANTANHNNASTDNPSTAPVSDSSSSPSSSSQAAQAQLSNTPFSHLNLEQLRNLQFLFIDERQWHQHHTPRNLVLALTGEVGELAELFQWKGEVAPGLPGWTADEVEHVKEELSDVLLYLIRLADVCHVDLAAAVLEKMAKNAIKYPVDQVQGSSAKYTAYTEADQHSEAGGSSSSSSKRQRTEGPDGASPPSVSSPSSANHSDSAHPGLCR